METQNKLEMAQIDQLQQALLVGGGDTEGDRQMTADSGMAKGHRIPIGIVL
jgi:hypothetical protein